MPYTPLPIGIDDFEKIITDGYYYVDKTWFIKELLDKKGEVNLFTRPRRFGKTLNMSMLRYFFEIPVDGIKRAGLFEGLKITGAGKKYMDRQGQYPVITLTLKSAKQPTWEMAYLSLAEDIAAEFERHGYLLTSENILEEDKEKFKKIRGRRAEQIDYAKSLAFLCKCLFLYYQKNVIILIDEYDVPLENAYYSGFYNEMISFIRSLFESALKTNPYLEFAVITGCLRISNDAPSPLGSKEPRQVDEVGFPTRLEKTSPSSQCQSIFTGLNNLDVISILNREYDEYFGFTEMEVFNMLCFYDRRKKMDTMREWYDGYRFGNAEVYNPWSVIHYVKRLCEDEEAFPTAAWSNTSSNSIVKDLVYRASEETKREIESLANGVAIEKKVHEDITYEDIYATEENLWNFLFFTGYLKQVGLRMEGVNRYVTMAIPNKELLYIYENTVENWFHDEVEVQDLSAMYTAMLSGDAQGFERELRIQLQSTISYMDNKEAFYHGFVLGLLANLKDYLKKSNREAGLGRYDILVYKTLLAKAVAGEGCRIGKI